MHGLCYLVLVVSFLFAMSAGAAETTGDRQAAWSNGLPKDPSFFPIGVWLQDPRYAQAYKDIGINLYVGLWRGPTEAQLTALQKAGMYVICSQNDYARELLGRNDPLIKQVVGWMHQDEPDNAQRLPAGGGYGPPVAPEKIVEDYQRLKKNDLTRPIYINLGQGVAWDQWVGRGVRTNKPEDYPEYVKGADIVSFDIYPVSSDRKIAGELWRVGFGVKRLKQWSAPDQPVWSFVECTAIAGGAKATPQQVRSMVWMALVNGARGIEYFVHEWDANKKIVSERQLLEDTQMRDAVKEINREIRELAPVLNSASVTDLATVSSSEKEVPIDFMVKRDGQTVYLFAVAMRGQKTTGTFTFKGLEGRWSAEAIGDESKLPVTDGVLRDEFSPWGVRIYRLTRQ